MNITILGAGAMGSLFGGRLAESGQSVTLVDVNDAHLEAIRRHGLRLETDDGDRHIAGMKTCRPEQVSGHADAVLVFTKTLHTDQALASIRPHLASHTLVLSLQNGLGNAETLSRHVAPEQVMIGMTNWPADMLEPGHARSHGRGVVRLLTLDAVERPAAAEMVAVLAGAGLDCSLDRNVWTSIWEKVAFNAAMNGLCAVTGCSVGQLDAVPEGFVLAREIVQEVIAVAQASGVEADLQRCLASVADAMAHHRTHKPSMLQDVLAGRPTEIASINGEVIARARQAGVPVPRVDTLYALVRLVEARALSAEPPA
ncbi:ketopantoate reductase family protein [Metapseudomonas otitidis]|uniref:ketopantoate reductase family protein n=1 Tax=Metapseudomonas otitidis TaxID=319939 RepID=UPI0013F697A2|nr:2-dehydropantoate 2-reductase [Pseudomonas otitidis]